MLVTIYLNTGLFHLNETALFFGYRFSGISIQIASNTFERVWREYTRGALFAFMMNGTIVLMFGAMLLCNSILANPDSLFSDTIPPIQLGSVEIATRRTIQPVHRLPEVHGTIVVAGKKNEVIELSKTAADLASVNQRQIFARVPGLMIWESDGSGVQIGIAARGLSPNRSWEFNTRQNGYDITPDVFGYPEAYYTPPMEAVERVEFIRGSASLQFGPQFGGLVNYVLKSGHGDKTLFYEGRQSLGSFGLLSSYNALGGTKGKWSYYAFSSVRKGNGWRENSAFSAQTWYGSLEYKASDKVLLGINCTRSNYLSQQPGGLTDNQFRTNWQASSRSRNWLSAPWNVAAIFSKLRFTERSVIDIKAFGVLAERSSVGFMQVITVQDTVNTATNAWNNRRLDIDAYQSWGIEVRWLQEYSLLGREHKLAAGVRRSDAHTHRQNDGIGSNGMDFDSDLASGKFGRSFFYDNLNTAAFAEQIFSITDRLTITTGLRLEDLAAQSRGYFSLTQGDFEPVQRNRTVLLAGLALQYTKNSVNVYGNLTQSFRPMVFGDLTPTATLDIIDPDLRDASGYNGEVGFRGTHRSWLNFDLSLFYMLYDNRIGTIIQDGMNFRTNIGTSVSKGAEIFLEWDPIKMVSGRTRRLGLSCFISGTWMDARYTRWNNPALSGDVSKSPVNKALEYAPEHVWRCGLNWTYKTLSAVIQWSYVDAVFTDALNTVEASANAQIGRLDAYDLLDISARYDFASHMFLQFSVNNAANSRYATRRASGYPGPGLLPGNGRTITVTFGLRV